MNNAFMFCGSQEEKEMQSSNQILNAKKEQFRVEIRSAKNRQTLNSNRLRGMPILATHSQDPVIPESIPNPFESPSRSSSQNFELPVLQSSTLDLPFRDSTAGEIFIEVQNLCKQRELLTQASFLANVKSLESFDFKHLIIPGNSYYQETLQSIIFLSAYLTLNFLNNIDITPQLLQKLSMLCLAYQQHPSSENYFLTLASLQAISRIAFFPVEFSLVSEDIMQGVLYWTEQNVLELEYHSFNVLYMIQSQCSQEEEQILARKYNFINICMARMTQAAKAIQRHSNVQNPQLLQQTLNMLLRIMQDNVISRIRQSSDSWSEQIQCMCECLSENSECFEFTELYMMVHIFFLTLTSTTSKEMQLTTILILNANKTVKKLLEIISLGMFCINAKDLMKLTLLVLQILLTLSNIDEFCQNGNPSYPLSVSLANQNNTAVLIPPSLLPKSTILAHVSVSELLDSLVPFLDRDFTEQKIKVNILKIFYNIGRDTKQVLEELLHHKQFVQALILIQEMNHNCTEINTEILLLLDRILCEVAVDSPEDLAVFLRDQGLRIYSLMLSSFDSIREHILMSYEHLSLIFDILNRQQSILLMNLLDVFKKHCHSYSFCQLAEIYLTQGFPGEGRDNNIAIEEEEIIEGFLSRMQQNELSDEESCEGLNEQEETGEYKEQYDRDDADDEREE